MAFSLKAGCYHNDVPLAGFVPGKGWFFDLNAPGIDENWELRQRNAIAVPFKGWVL
jgi:hypothetical protein